MKFMLLALLAIHLASAEWKSYASYKQVEVVPRNWQQVEALRQWMLEDDIDFWLEPHGLNLPVHILVPLQEADTILSRLHELGLDINVIDSDVGTSVEAERQRLAAKPRAVDLGDFNEYEDIMIWMDELAAGCLAPLQCEVYTAEHSYEGRAINVFRVTASADAEPPAYYLDATIHAREWLAPATLINILNHMVTNYGADSDVTYLLDNYEYYFMPVQNPDGYVYTFSDDRLWRKNRRENSDVGSPCVGTDLNRNFDFRWCMEGASTNPCSDTYCGPSGGSEVEVQAVQNEAMRLANRIQAYVTLHTYGYMWMFPWGNTIDYAGAVCERADDHDDMDAVAEYSAAAIAATHGTSWAHGTSCEVIYATTGSTEDWTKGVAGIKYGICAELRGNGFIVSQDEIQPSSQEIWNGIVALEEAIINMSNKN